MRKEKKKREKGKSKNPTQAGSSAGLQRSPLGRNFNFTQEFCSFVNYFQMKREIFLRRVRKGPRQDLNFKGELFAKKTQGERREGELREEREAGEVPPLPRPCWGHSEDTAAP